MLNIGIVISPWEKLTIDRCISESTEITTRWINFLEDLTETELDKIIEYKNTKGETYSNSTKDILMHVISHSTYHRGQIAQLVRAGEGKPAVTDYIFYQRSAQAS